MDEHHHRYHFRGQSSSRIFIAFLANFFFAVIEMIFGRIFNSSAILADAVHDFGDAMAIGTSYYFERLSKRRSDYKYTLGYLRFSLLGALMTAVILILGSVFVLIENVQKVFNPEPVNYRGMFILGIIAIIVNVIASRVLNSEASEHESVLSLHFLEDILGWLAVIVVSVILRFTDWYFLDPLLSIMIAVFILSQALPKFIRNISVFLERSPANFDIRQIENEILSIDSVMAINQLNVWSLDGRRNIAMVHLLVAADGNEQLIKDQVHHIFHAYNIVESAVECDHSTFQHLHHSSFKRDKI
ncbi:cation transporter [Streptococcus chenjunshii]|uniref:Cation transporter n=1 Tax=Streptococcus chenjunshii TaxID=2173853 RepID=A0A372KNV2_9STRE|nr:cation diffusion facilitator family transporter [Streptococcus chenjunshii]AXQ78748.1 cation transporter [Streptococcus chenjunshii]RFU51659.1 cation transporter [Streptococcus chenjunshii]RFU53980.1 cation transporter [Streptococcus chenjunshii]